MTPTRLLPALLLALSTAPHLAAQQATSPAATTAPGIGGPFFGPGSIGAGVRPVLDYDFNDAVLPIVDAANTVKGHRVAVDEATGVAFAVAIKSDAVAVVDLAAGALVRTMDLPSGPGALKFPAFDPVRRQLSVITSKPDARLMVLDVDSGALVHDLDLGADVGGALSYPVQGLVVDPVSGKHYALVSGGPGRRILQIQPATGAVKVLLLGESVFDLRWHADTLYALVTVPDTGPGTYRSEVILLPHGDESSASTLTLSYASIAPDPPPGEFAVDDAGQLFASVGDKVWRFDGATGAEVWGASAPEEINRIEVAGGEVALLQKYGADGASDEHVSRVTTLDATTGALLTTRPARYEAESLAAGAGGGFVVGNGGDASVTVLPAGLGGGATAQVGTSVEDMLFTPDGKRLLVLNRLCGSQLYVCDLASGDVTVVELPGWPTRMKVVKATNKLLVMSHFESRVDVLDLDSLVLESTVEYSPSNSISDTLGDMAFTRDGSLLAVLAAEEGAMYVIDRSVDPPAVTDVALGPESIGGGPGRYHAAIDDRVSGARSVFVLDSEMGTLTRYDETAGWAPVLSVGVTVTPAGYAQRALYFSHSLGKLFHKNQRIEPSTLSSAGEPAYLGVHRFFGERGGVLYGQRRVNLTETYEEYLVTYPAGSTVPDTNELICTVEGLDSKFAFDHVHGWLAYSLPVLGEAHLMRIP